MLAKYSMYDLLVPPLVVKFRALDAILTKLAAHIEAHQLNEAFFLNDRLYPDMFPFVRQVGIATDMTKGAVGRLTDAAIPTFEDNEVSVAQLRERVQALIAFLDTLQPSQFDGAEVKSVHLKFGNGFEKSFDDGLTYVLNWALPQVYFHLTTAYDILRHRGVVLGKADYLGQV